MANRGGASDSVRGNLGDSSSNDLPHTGKPSKKIGTVLGGMAWEGFAF